MQNISINTHAYIDQHLTGISSFINGKYDCRRKLGKNTYLIENLICNQLRRCNVPPNHRPVCSLVSQQRCHPRAEHDFPRNKELVGLHIAKITKHAKPTHLGLSGYLGVGKGQMLSW